MASYLCIHCGASFNAKPSHQQRYCSVACRGEAQKRSAVDRFWARVDTSSGPNSCWLWIGPSARGYGRILVGGWREGGIVRAHRFSWELHFGPIPEGLCVCHACDVRNCVQPAHLWLGTRQDNNRDRHEKGRTLPARNRVVRRKLSDNDRIAIRSAPVYRGSANALAAQYGVSRGLICQVRKPREVA